jgi:nucleoid-associated protein YgaU
LFDHAGWTGQGGFVVDGVERVMVLGILAVIVAILSFAWSATDESTTPVGGLRDDPGRPGATIPLRNNTSSGDPVVLDEAARTRIQERMRANNAAKEAQLQQRWDLMNAGQTGGRPANPQAGAPLGTVPGTAPAAPGARGTRRNPAMANGHPGQLQAPDLPGSGSDGFEQLAHGTTRDTARERTPARLDLPAPGVLPSTQQIPLKPAAARNEAREDGSDEQPGFRLYTVVEGDTLWSIARRSAGHGDIKRMLARIEQSNPGLDAGNLSIGRTIKLPAPVTSRVRMLTPAERVEEAGGLVYIVVEGDTLGAIAARELGSGGRWVEIYQLNKATLADPEQIRPGQKLLLPEG